MGSMGESMGSLLTASRASLVQHASEGSFKHLKLEGSLSHTSLASDASAKSTKALSFSSSETTVAAAAAAAAETAAAAAPPQSSPSSVVSPEQGKHHPEEERTTASVQEESKDGGHSEAGAAPLKATNFGHLRQKYLPELEYMLTEFKKLERQLLGAKAASRESAGSRERREKLHSFILHLEETIQQVHTGCQLEAEGKSTISDSMENSALIQLTQEKKEEENVQKLEEHILANLLPVKVRLKKQLAAQQGAKHNPAGMPVRGSLPATQKDKGKATFSAAAASGGKQHRRGSASSATHFGKPLEGGGSKLTQKLHGSTLGSSNRTYGHGVGTSAKDVQEADSADSKILFAGMAIGSDQVKSSVAAARSAHKMVIKDPAVLDMANKKAKLPTKVNISSTQPALPEKTLSSAAREKRDLNLAAEEERRRIILKRKKRKRKRQSLEEEKIKESEAKKQPQSSKRKKGVSGCKKRGPRPVEYMCALCNEVYGSTCEYNPWWALTQHECPKCRKTQIPRVDINAAANAIEYHPALLAHADEHGGTGNASAPPPPVQVPPPKPATVAKDSSDTDSLGSDLSDEDWEGIISDDDSIGSDHTGTEALAAKSPAGKAENERFGAEYSGPKLSENESARLLILMAHASTCPCQHKLAKQRDTCKNTKWMMLHVRDCPGTTSTFDVCPFPWCRKVKHLLYHLVSCRDPDSCPICTPKNISSGMAQLGGLNEHRMKKYRERLVSRMRAAASARTKPMSSSSKAGKPSSARAATAKSQASKPSQYRKAVATTKVSSLPKTVAAARASKTVPSKASVKRPSIQVNAKPSSVAVKAESASMARSLKELSKKRAETVATKAPPKVKAEPLSTQQKAPKPSLVVAAAAAAAAAASVASTNTPSQVPPLEAVETTTAASVAAASTSTYTPSQAPPLETTVQTLHTDTASKTADPTPTSDGVNGSQTTDVAASTSAEPPKLKIKVESTSSLQNPKVPEDSPTAPSPTLTPDAAMKGVLPIKPLPELKIEDEGETTNLSPTTTKQLTEPTTAPIDPSGASTMEPDTEPDVNISDKSSHPLENKSKSESPFDVKTEERDESQQDGGPNADAPGNTPPPPVKENKPKSESPSNVKIEEKDESQQSGESNTNVLEQTSPPLENENKSKLNSPSDVKIEEKGESQHSATDARESKGSVERSPPDAGRTTCTDQQCPGEVSEPKSPETVIFADNKDTTTSVDQAANCTTKPDSESNTKETEQKELKESPLVDQFEKPNGDSGSSDVTENQTNHLLSIL